MAATSGYGRDQYPSSAWARKMPALIIPKTAVIVSSIAFILIPSGWSKEKSRCTVKRILVARPTPLLADDFWQHNRDRSAVPRALRTAASDWPEAAILRPVGSRYAGCVAGSWTAQLRGLIHQLTREAGIVEPCLGVGGEVSDQPALDAARFELIDAALQIVHGSAFLLFRGWKCKPSFCRR